MINGVSPVTPVAVDPVAPLGAGAASPGESLFAGMLQRAIERVETTGAQANTAAESFLTGASNDVHSVALAAQRASLQLEYVLQVRNKVVQAYQEIMRMQL